MTRTDYAFGMSTTPSDPDYPNPKRLAGMMRAFDHVVMGKQQAHVSVEQLAKAAQQQQEVMSNPSLMFRPQQSKARRGLNLFSLFRHIRDGIRLRKYNREWSKNNPPMTIAEAISRVSDIRNRSTSTPTKR